MNKTKTRRFTVSSRTRLVGKIIKTTAIVVFSVLWLYTFTIVYGKILSFYG
jgi:hypothetical protein